MKRGRVVRGQGGTDNPRQPPDSSRLVDSGCSLLRHAPPDFTVTTGLRDAQSTHRATQSTARGARRNGPHTDPRRHPVRLGPTHGPNDRQQRRGHGPTGGALGLRERAALETQPREGSHNGAGRPHPPRGEAAGCSGMLGMPSCCLLASPVPSVPPRTNRPRVLTDLATRVTRDGRSHDSSNVGLHVTAR